MEMIGVLLWGLLLMLGYLIVVGGKECYFCGYRLNSKLRKIYSRGKRSCLDCSIHNEKVDKMRGEDDGSTN
jgi:hypothetical protein